MIRTPKTFHACPRTSSRLRPNDSKTPLFSRTIEGGMSAHQVRRIRPGTMRKTSPKAIPSPARIDAPRSGHTRGQTFEKVSLTPRSDRPSRMSATASTSAPVSQKIPISRMIAPTSAPHWPRKMARTSVIELATR